MRIYTRTGDKGKTSLVGGLRVSKDALRIEAYGTVDELNALLGIAAASSREKTLRKILTRLQNELFIVGADLATPDAREERRHRVPRIGASHAKALESIIDSLDSKLPPLSYFILPGGDRLAAELHLARAVCRRAERVAVRLSRSEEVNPHIVGYLNRLSDLLFVLARWVNCKRRRREVRWRNPG